MLEREIKDEERGPIRQFYDVVAALRADVVARSPRLKEYAASVPELQFIVAPSDEEFTRMVAARFRLDAGT
jgi:hypothetical protein